jgi:hypothetical protein
LFRVLSDSEKVSEGFPGFSESVVENVAQGQQERRVVVELAKMTLDQFGQKFVVELLDLRRVLFVVALNVGLLI